MLRTGLGPPSLTCECGRVHRLPAAPAAQPAPPPAPGPATPPDPPIRNPFSPRERLAIHDGPHLAPPTRNLSPFSNPVVAGSLSVGVLLLALIAAALLRARARGAQDRAHPDGAGTECTFINAGVTFTAPAGWTLTKRDGMVFGFDAPRGTVAVRIVPSSPQPHEEAVAGEAPAPWSPSTSELPGASCLTTQWNDGAQSRHGTSWWIDRGTHRLWILAVGDTRLRRDLKPLFDSFRLDPPTDPVPEAPPR